MAEVPRFALRVENPSGGGLKGFYGNFNGSGIAFDGDPTPRAVRLANIKTLAVNFNNIATADYYNCESAEFTGFVPDILPLSVVTIYTSGFKDDEDASTMYARFSGRAEIPGAPDRLVRADDDVAYRLVGHLEECKTSVDDNWQYDESETIASLWESIANAHKPASVLSVFNNLTSSGIVLGEKYNPNYNLLNEVLQSLVDKLRAKGADVKYGINGKRELWLRQVGSGIFSVGEGQSEHIVDWPEVVAQDYFNKVRYEISTGNLPTLFFPNDSRNPTLETPDLLTHVCSIGYGPFEKVKPVEVPSDVVALKPLPTSFTTSPASGSVGYELTEGSTIASFVGGTEDPTPTRSRIFDGNPTSYTVFEMNDPPLTPTKAIEIRVRFGSGIAVRDVVAVKLRLKPDGSGQSNESVSGYPITASIGLSNGSSEITLSQTLETLNEVDGYFLVGDKARGVDGTSAAPDIRLSIALFRSVGAPNPIRVAVEDFRFFTIDVDELSAQATKEYSVPTSSQFKAGKHGPFSPQPFVAVTRRDGGSYTVAADMFRVEISGEKDIISSAFVGEGALYGLEGVAALKIRRQERLGRSKAAKSALRRLP